MLVGVGRWKQQVCLHQMKFDFLPDQLPGFSTVALQTEEHYHYWNMMDNVDKSIYQQGNR